MFDTLSRRITDIRVSEIASDFLWFPLRAPKKAPDIPYQFQFATGAPTPHGVCFDILVEKLTRVEFRAVSGQKEQTDPSLMGHCPAIHRRTYMNRMTVDYEKHLASGVTNQSAKKRQKYGCSETPFEYHECQPSAIGDHGDHVASEPLPRSRNYRCVPPPSPRAASLMIGTHPRLVAPENRGFFALCQGSDRGVFLCQPLAHRLGVSFVRPAQRFLRCESPMVEVSAHCPDRKTNPGPLRNQIPHRLARPQGKRHLQLVRATVGNQPHDGGRLMWGQSNARWSSPRPRPQGSKPVLFPSSVPCIDGLTGYLEYFCRVGLRHSLRNGTDYPTSQHIQGIWRKTTRIFPFHATKYSMRLS